MNQRQDFVNLKECNFGQHKPRGEYLKKKKSCLCYPSISDIFNIVLCFATFCVKLRQGYEVRDLRWYLIYTTQQRIKQQPSADNQNHPLKNNKRKEEQKNINISSIMRFLISPVIFTHIGPWYCHMLPLDAHSSKKVVGLQLLGFPISLQFIAKKPHIGW